MGTIATSLDHDLRAASGSGQCDEGESLLTGKKWGHPARMSSGSLGISDYAEEAAAAARPGQGCRGSERAEGAGWREGALSVWFLVLTVAGEVFRFWVLAVGPKISS